MTFDATTRGLTGLEYFHLDVFTDYPLSGNGVIVFPDATGLDGDSMLLLTQEMRQFESIFLSTDLRAGSCRARIFTTEEELEFAGHPVLGAAAVQHHLYGHDHEIVSSFELGGRTLDVSTRREPTHYAATMEQGAPTFRAGIAAERIREVVAALGLHPSDVAPELPVQVVSTGLPYLIVPLRRGIERVSVTHPNFGALLATFGARFCYPFDVERYEGRTFDNHGLIEDVATGSAAGPTGAYLVAHGRAPLGSAIVLNQGRFVGRPSRMTVRVTGTRQTIENVTVSGEVAFVAAGRLGDPRDRSSRQPG